MKNEHILEFCIYLVVPCADDLCDRDVIDFDLPLTPHLDDQWPPSHGLDHPVLLLLWINLQTSHQLGADNLAQEDAII